MVRNQSIEILRIISAFGIVYFHSSGLDLPYAGLVAFAVISGYFEIGPNYNRQRDTKKLGRQFLIPWAIWFVFFSALNIAMGKPAVPNDNGIVAAFLSGPSIHLWYLPFAFAFLAIVGTIKDRHRPITIFFVALLLTIFGLASIPTWRPLGPAIVPPYGQYLHIFTPLVAGLVLGLQQRLKWGWLATALILCVSASMIRWPGIGIPYTLGIAAVWIAKTINFQSLNVEKFSSCMFGVYLCHPFFIMVNYHFGFERGLHSALLAFVCSTAFIFILRLLPPFSGLGKLVRLAV